MKRREKAVYLVMADGCREMIPARSIGHAVHQFRRLTGIWTRTDRGAWKGLSVACLNGFSEADIDRLAARIRSRRIIRWTPTPPGFGSFLSNSPAGG